MERRCGRPSCELDRPDVFFGLVFFPVEYKRRLPLFGRGGTETESQKFLIERLEIKRVAGVVRGKNPERRIIFPPAELKRGQLVYRLDFPVIKPFAKNRDR